MAGEAAMDRTRHYRSRGTSVSPVQPGLCAGVWGADGSDRSDEADDTDSDDDTDNEMLNLVV